jgi:hypothetical protein
VERLTRLSDLLLAWIRRLPGYIIDRVKELPRCITRWFWLLPDRLANWVRQRLGRPCERVAYLSDFERRLNRWLWAILWITSVYGLFQHVFLANIPEQFRGGARLGGLLYDLAIAYSVAFIFYLLVVRLPLRRDRDNTYRLTQPLTMRIISQAQNLMNMLTQAANLRVSRPNSRQNVDEVCRSIGLASPAYPRIDELRKLSSSPARLDMLGIDDSTTVVDVINQSVSRARDLNREMLGFASLLPSDMVNLIAWIDDCNFFQAWDGIYPLLQRGLPPNPDLTFLADNLFEYLRLAELLDQYREKFLPGEPGKPPELDSDVVPLSGYTN